MRRRDFLGAVSGAAVALPLAVRAQQPERVRYIGMINTLGSDDPETQARIAVFEQALAELGWVIGRNLKIEIRQIGGDIEHGHRDAAELVALAPEVIVTIGSVGLRKPLARCEEGDGGGLTCPDRGFARTEAGAHGQHLDLRLVGLDL
jgi:putative ABC transport system substrate-binding protein